MTSPAWTLLVSALLTSALAVTGCGAEERTFAVNGNEVSLDTDAGSISAAPRGSADSAAGTDALPEDFPEVAVPVIEGVIVGGAKNTTDGTTTWSVIVQVAGDVESVLATVTQQLKAAGYAGESASNLDGHGAAQFRGAYTVGVSINAADEATSPADEVTVTYVVSPSRPG